MSGVNRRRSRLVGVRLTPAEFEAACAAALRERCTVQEVMRRSIGLRAAVADYAEELNVRDAQLSRSGVYYFGRIRDRLRGLLAGAS